MERSWVVLPLPSRLIKALISVEPESGVMVDCTPAFACARARASASWAGSENGAAAPEPASNTDCAKTGASCVELELVLEFAVAIDTPKLHRAKIGDNDVICC